MGVCGQRLECEARKPQVKTLWAGRSEPEIRLLCPQLPSPKHCCAWLSFPSPRGPRMGSSSPTHDHSTSTGHGGSHVARRICQTAFSLDNNGLYGTLANCGGNGLGLTREKPGMWGSALDLRGARQELVKSLCPFLCGEGWDSLRGCGGGIGLNRSAGGDGRRLKRHREVTCARGRKLSRGSAEERVSALPL